MYHDFCNGNLSAKCNETRPVVEEDWPLERVVSMVVPLFFGLIGLGGLLGNVLVVIGKLERNSFYLFEKSPRTKNNQILLKNRQKLAGFIVFGM